jgi:hypothetical protein
MAEPKTHRTKASVTAFIAAVEDETRRQDAKAVDKLFRQSTGQKPDRSCFYINKLADVDEVVLRKVVAKGWKIMATK